MVPQFERFSCRRPLAWRRAKSWVPPLGLKSPFVFFALLSTLWMSAPDARAQDDAARLGAYYLKSVQEPSGLFRYEFDFLTSEFTADNNIIRQAGAAYGLAEYLRHSADGEIEETIANALHAYVALSLPFGEGQLLAPPNRERTDTGAGATALALLAELQYQEASGDQQFRANRDQWLQGLLSLYRPGQGISEYPGADSESPYYNGETWLALAYYADLFPKNQRVQSVLRRLDPYLIKKYSLEPNVSFYHWGAMASVIRFGTTGERRFLKFASSQTNHYLTIMRPAFLPDVNTCYELEGLISVAEIMDESDERYLANTIGQRIDREHAKILAFQIQPGQKEIRFGGGRYLYSEDIPSFAGAFLNGPFRPQTRIDSTQHCLSALVKYDRYRASSDHEVTADSNAAQ